MTSLLGNELVLVLPQRVDGTPAAVPEEVTTQQIANLAPGGAGLALIVTNATANVQFGVLPPRGFLLYALFRETSGVAVSLGIGSTSGANDVLDAVEVPANGGLTVPINSFSTGWFSDVSSQTLYLSSPSWGGATVGGFLVYQSGP